MDSAPLRLSATRKIATTWSIKEQFPSSLGHTHSDLSPPIEDGCMLTSRIRTCLDTDILSPHIQTERICHLTNMSHVGELMFPHPPVPCVTTQRTRHCVFYKAFYILPQSFMICTAARTLAMQFNSPGARPRSGAFCLPQYEVKVLLFFGWRLQLCG